MFEEFFDDLSKIALPEEPAQEVLDGVGSLLTRLARSTDWNVLGLRQAVGTEELVHVLHETRNGPSLYVVSDAAGVRSMPHVHPTWAVIVGLSGSELNVVYELDDPGTRMVKAAHARHVESGDFISLPTGAIHSTHAIGPQPTFHLHLYGLPLGEFSPYESRCYVNLLP